MNPGVNNESDAICGKSAPPINRLMLSWLGCGLKSWIGRIYRFGGLVYQALTGMLAGIFHRLL